MKKNLKGFTFPGMHACACKIKELNLSLTWQPCLQAFLYTKSTYRKYLLSKNIMIFQVEITSKISVSHFQLQSFTLFEIILVYILLHRS